MRVNARGRPGLAVFSEEVKEHRKTAPGEQRLLGLRDERTVLLTQLPQWDVPTQGIERFDTLSGYRGNPQRPTGTSSSESCRKPVADPGAGLVISSRSSVVWTGSKEITVGWFEADAQVMVGWETGT